MLDGEDDYAILPLAEHGYIFPRNTDEFTVEVWFYPKAETEPEPGESNIILSQQVRFGLVPNNQCRDKVSEKDQVCSYGSAYLEGAAAHGVRSKNAAIKRINGTIWQLFHGQHVLFSINNQIVNIGEGDFMNVVAEELHVRDELKDFVVGYLVREDVFMVKLMRGFPISLGMISRWGPAF